MTPPGEAAPTDHEESLHRALGLTDDEFEAVGKILGRPPNHLELALYAVMWSEHCSYKSSRLHLRRLPTEGPRVLVGPGENAGVIDAGDGIAVAIRIESHNHPSAIEPYQGAATGVGGILRDIFTMGARPLAVMDPLFFGPPDDARQRWLVEGVVAGISGYGNSVGVPTVGGELTFDACYAQNPLVNVLCLGALPTERLVLGHRVGAGQPGRAARLEHRPGRHRRGQRAGLRRVQRRRGGCGRRHEATERPGGRPVRGEAAHRGVPRVARHASWWSASRTSAGPALPARRVRRRDAAASAWTSTCRRSHGARTDGAVGGDDEREPGAHARHRDARVMAGGQRHLWQVGGAGHRHRHGDGARSRRRRAPAHPRRSRRPDPGRRAGRLALRRRAALRPARGRRPTSRTAPAARPPATDSAADLLALLRSARWVYRQYDHQLFLNTVAGPGADAALLRLAGPGLPPSVRGRGRHNRFQPSGVCARPAGRHGAGARRGGGQPCVRRCDARRGGQLPQLRQPRTSRGDVAAVRVHRRHGRRLPRPLAAGDRRQRQPLQRERRAPTSTRRPCSGVLGLVDELQASPPGTTWVRRGCARLARCPLGHRRLLPPGGDSLGHRVSRPPQRVGAARSTSLRTAPPVPSWPPWSPRRWRGAETTSSTRCTTCRVAAWPSPWPRWPPSPALAACSRWPVGRPSSSPSCRRASWWRPPGPDELCARAAEAGIPASVLGRAEGDRLVLGELVDLPLAAVRRPSRGT